MAQPVIQTSFNAGEWAPSLNARVDLAKYHAGAALLRNFFVDYRGGATARAGTKYILQTKSTDTVRLISFQASFAVTYVLEFGNQYIRFYNNGAPVLEASKAISTITQTNPGVITSNAHGYSDGDWVFVDDVVGMTELNDNYYIIANSTPNDYTLTDLNGVAVDTTTFTAYISGGTTQRVYTLASPYLASELAQLKFSQNVSAMIFCHPNYAPYQLTLISAASWTMAAIVFGATISPPSAPLFSSGGLAAGVYSYAYVVTSVDANGQESAPSAFAAASSLQDLRVTANASIYISWAAVTGAVAYNVYKAEQAASGGAVSAGSAFGFVGSLTGLRFTDSNIAPDFSQPPPLVQSPFSGSAVQTITLTANASYTIVPTVTLTAAPPGGTTASASVILSASSIGIQSSDAGFTPGTTFSVGFGVVIQITSVGSFGVITGVAIVAGGAISSGGVAALVHIDSGAPLFGQAYITLGWTISSIQITQPGAGYLLAPSVSFSPAGASATTTIGAAANIGNPTVPGFFQQRLVLAGPTGSPQQFNMSQPGAYYNFNTSTITQPDDAITGTLVSGQLNTIKAMISQPQGLAMLADRQAWLLNGGSAGSGISATQIVANPQSFNGSADLPPILANDHVLYVQSKNSIVRDLAFNWNTQNYTGTDISVLSSHLFYGYTILEWAWAEEPFKVVWAVRNDGILLSLTFLKEQELIAWAHSDTEGTFKSIAAVTETVAVGAVDAIYVVVQRIINGNTIQYIERMSELYYPTGLTDAWCVDAGIQYNGTATLTFRGAQHLAGATVTGIATDNLGVVYNLNFTMPTNGSFTLDAPTLPATGYTRVTVGLPYTPQLQTLALDTGEPTIQGKMKKISGVTVRVNKSLGLKIGSNFDNLVDMEDLIIGNVGKDSNELVTDLVTADILQALDPAWTVPGQYTIQQSLPYPCSILGVIPQLTTGDTKDARS